MSCIVTLPKAFVRQRSSWRWGPLLIFGFEENQNTEQICLGLQLLTVKGLEWQQAKPVFILGADVKAAFDELRLDPVLRSLHHWGFPGELVAALTEEALELAAVASLQEVTTEEFSHNKSMRTGGIESAWEWNIVMRRILD